VTLQGSGADVILIAATPKFGAQAIRKSFDLGWAPMRVISNVTSSIKGALKPAGFEKSQGLITATYGKDPTDPRWKDDPGLKEWSAFVAKHLSASDSLDNNAVYGFGAAQTMVQVLKQCGDDLSRENIMKQAANRYIWRRCAPRSDGSG
jgi:branched-chain amino acid transport system substrate-binding protein